MLCVFSVYLFAKLFEHPSYIQQEGRLKGSGSYADSGVEGARLKKTYLLHTRQVHELCCRSTLDSEFLVFVVVLSEFILGNTS